MSRALFDVNVLLAIFDPDHMGHPVAQAWLDADPGLGWATCAVTENGFVRVYSTPSYSESVTPDIAASALREAARTGDWERWLDDVSILDADTFDHTRIHGHRQITDAYLLALAVKHDGCLVTFDRSIPLSAVRGAEPRHLVVL